MSKHTPKAQRLEALNSYLGTSYQITDRYFTEHVEVGSFTLLSQDELLRDFGEAMKTFGGDADFFRSLRVFKTLKEAKDDLVGGHLEDIRMARAAIRDIRSYKTKRAKGEA